MTGQSLPNQPAMDPAEPSQAVALAALPGKAEAPRGCSFADGRLIAKLLENPPSRTREGLTDRFGISYNMWRRLMAGQPVRTSVLVRLEQRLGLGDIRG